MPRERFIDRKFTPGSLKIIAVADKIIRDYVAQGFTLTLRQLYYQFVARDLIANKQSEYKRLGSIINDARLAGLIDWNAIEDRTRNLKKLPHWASPSEVIEVLSEQFRFDVWEDQEYRPEVWIEKDALIGVIEPACNELAVPYFACRGYSSQSEQWRAGKRMQRHIDNGQKPIIFHLGDHDPSGIDMTRDNDDRVNLFSSNGVEVKRLALNMKQVEKYSPPPNPAKMTDSRVGDYIERFGDESWELDALEPTVIDKLIRDAIDDITDHDMMARALERQDNARGRLGDVAQRWDDIVSFLEK